MEDNNPNQLDETKLKKGLNPLNNKLRLVYAVDANGDPVSYKYIEHNEAETMIRIIQFIQKFPGKKYTYEMLVKELKINYYAIKRAVTKMQGIQYADLYEGGRREKFFERTPVWVRNKMIHSKSNLHPKFKKLRPATYIIFPNAMDSTSCT